MEATVKKRKYPPRGSGKTPRISFRLDKSDRGSLDLIMLARNISDRSAVIRVLIAEERKRINSEKSF